MIEPTVTGVPYSVSVVLDRTFGPRLRELLEAGPVWAVDSPANRDSAKRLWEEFPSRDHLDGVTIFMTGKDYSPAQMLIGQMETIDLHHGVYSADPPYTTIRIFGSELTIEVRETLAEFGFDSFKITDEGFDAVRPLPPPPE
jgi:hypothetical protein